MPEEQNPAEESRFRKEDMLLYIISFLIICFLTYVVVDTRNSTLTAFQHEDSSKRIPDADMFRFESQRTRYDYATKCLISNSVRVNMGFLAGVVISLMGVILVVRQVRDTIELGAKSNLASGSAQDLNLKTTSPGVLITFMGCAIIMTAMLSKDRISLEADLLDASQQKAAAVPDSIRKSLAPPLSTADTTKRAPDTTKAGKVGGM